MNRPPVRPGAFIWCAFPESERPLVPGPRHVAYIISIVRHPGHDLSALVAYTTTKPWNADRRPKGIRLFDAEEARQLGQTKPFVLDARRVAYLPLTTFWFPDLNKPANGVLGLSPAKLKAELEAIVTELLMVEPPIVDRLGPSWPRR